MKKEKNVIDIVIPWVDASEEGWKKEKNKYLEHATEFQKNNNVESRYREGINLKYWFRAIENCMPWVRYIFFVSCGQVPSFLDLTNKKLKIINHSSYIPEEYLPTFNSNTIEMNLFRIDELSENFILFNDDVFPIRKINPEYFFYKDKVCDEAIERIFAPKINESMYDSYTYCQLNNMQIINKYFKKRVVQRKHFFKWFNLRYGKKMLNNIALARFYDFDRISNKHLANAFKKSTFKEIWMAEYETCNRASMNKFRNYTDISQYLVRWWQLCKGDFYPKKRVGKMYSITDENFYQIADSIKRREQKIVCINDTKDISDYSRVKKIIEEAFEEIFPVKSSYER